MFLSLPLSPNGDRTPSENSLMPPLPPSKSSFRSLTIGGRTGAPPISGLLRPWAHKVSPTQTEHYVSVNVPVSPLYADIKCTPAREWIKNGQVQTNRAGEPIMIGPFFSIGELTIKDSKDVIAIHTPTGVRLCRLTCRCEIGLVSLDEPTDPSLTSSVADELNVEESDALSAPFIPSEASLIQGPNDRRPRSTRVSSFDGPSAFRNPLAEPPTSSLHSPSRSTRAITEGTRIAAESTRFPDRQRSSFNSEAERIDLNASRSLISDREWAFSLSELAARYNASCASARRVAQTELQSLERHLSSATRLSPSEQTKLEHRIYELEQDIKALTFEIPDSALPFLSSDPHPHPQTQDPHQTASQEPSPST